MTYQKFKETVIEKDNGVMTEKQFKSFLIRYALLLLTVTIELVMVVSAITNTLITSATAIIMIVAFIWFLDWCAEDEIVLSRFNKVSKVSFLVSNKYDCLPLYS